MLADSLLQATIILSPAPDEASIHPSAQYYPRATLLIFIHPK
jgi:hypothetical protein